MNCRIKNCPEDALFGLGVCYYHHKVATGLTEPAPPEEERDEDGTILSWELPFEYSERDKAILAEYKGSIPKALPKRKLVEIPKEERILRRTSELTKTEIPKGCRGCIHQPATFYQDTLQERKRLCLSCFWQKSHQWCNESKQVECCATCRYLRWSKPTRETMNPLEVEECRAGIRPWDDVWYTMGWVVHTEVDYDERGQVIPATGRNVHKWERKYRFPCETGEYMGVPMCDLGERDFNEELGISWEAGFDPENPGRSSTRRDGKLARLMDEHWQWVTDPARIPEFIRRRPNPSMSELRREVDEMEDPYPDFGHIEQMPLPSEASASEAGQWDTEPDEPERGRRMSAGKGRNNRVTMYTSKFINDMLWDSGCHRGVHNKTGRTFTSWPNPYTREKNPLKDGEMPMTFGQILCYYEDIVDARFESNAIIYAERVSNAILDHWHAQEQDLAKERMVKAMGNLKERLAMRMQEQ